MAFGPRVVIDLTLDDSSDDSAKKIRARRPLKRPAGPLDARGENSPERLKLEQPPPELANKDVYTNDSPFQHYESLLQGSNDTVLDQV